MRRACLLGLFVVYAVDAGPKLYLKTRVIDTGRCGGQGGQARNYRRRVFRTKHLIIQLITSPGMRTRNAG